MLKKPKRSEPNKKTDTLSSQGELEHQKLKQAEQEYLERLAGTINIAQPPMKHRTSATPQPLSPSTTPSPGSPPYPRPLHSPKPVPTVQGDFEVEVEMPGSPVIVPGKTSPLSPNSSPAANPAVVNRLIRSYTPPPQFTPPPAQNTPLPPAAEAPVVSVAPPPTPSASLQNAPSPPPVAPPQETEGTFPIGTIIRLEDGTVGIYKDPVRGKEYEIVYCLRPSGRVSPEGIALFAYNAQRIGMLPKNVLDRMQRTMRWDRDTIVYHLDSFEFCSLVPYPGTGSATEHGTHDFTPLPLLTEKLPETPRAGSGHTPLPTSPATPAAPSAPAAAPAAATAAILVRGRRLRISFGQGKSWDAVFWGRDDLDYIVAHRTHNSWGLMHLDLARFKDSTEVGDILPPQEIQAIEREIVQTQDR